MSVIELTRQLGAAIQQDERYKQYEEARKAIEKYQKEHPLHYGAMLDVTAISSKAGAEIISQTVEKISKKVEEDTDFWCICEMAKMYMQGVKPVYPARQQGEWKLDDTEQFCYCSFCEDTYYPRPIDPSWYYCPHCGADMRGE